MTNRYQEREEFEKHASQLTAVSDGVTNYEAANVRIRQDLNRGIISAELAEAQITANNNGMKALLQTLEATPTPVVDPPPVEELIDPVLEAPTE